VELENELSDPMVLFRSGDVSLHLIPLKNPRFLEMLSLNWHQSVMIGGALGFFDSGCDMAGISGFQGE
jgi:hypothetical protein